MSRYEEPGDPDPAAPGPSADADTGAAPAEPDEPVTPDEPAMPDGSGAPPGRRRRQARTRGRRWLGGRYSTTTVTLGGLAGLLAVVLVAGSLTVYLKYREVWDSINHVDVSADLHGSRPPADPKAINLLLIGSDSRVGKNGVIGGNQGIGGARSDTDMLIHIAPGAHHVVVISIPRDSVVPILNCAAEDGATGQTAQPGQIEQINATFAYGGPGCLWKTIEQTTGIHISDFIELTFVGFEQAINALGGVSVCLPAAVNDPMSGLKLPAGEHHVYGTQALAFWRTREDLGMGDDPQRIQRDQYLMAALVQGIEHSGLLNSPGKMLSVIDALTSNRNITIDNQLTPGGLLHIAEAMRGIATGSVQFVTVPWTTYAPNPNWVQWLQPNAGHLFSAIAHDTALPKSVKPRKPGKGKKGKHAAMVTSVQPSQVQPAQVEPAQVQVAIYNGSTTSELATSTSTALSARGFKVIGQPADAASNTYTDSVIEYASAAELPQAQLLAKQIGTAADVRLELDPQLSSTDPLQLILGSTFSTLQPVQPAPTSSSTIQNIAGTYGGIAGNVNICSDQAAFAGPNGY